MPWSILAAPADFGRSSHFTALTRFGGSRYRLLLDRGRLGRGCRAAPPRLCLLRRYLLVDPGSAGDSRASHGACHAAYCRTHGATDCSASKGSSSRLLQHAPAWSCKQQPSAPVRPGQRCALTYSWLHPRFQPHPVLRLQTHQRQVCSFDLGRTTCPGLAFWPERSRHGLWGEAMPIYCAQCARHVLWM